MNSKDTVSLGGAMIIHVHSLLGFGMLGKFGDDIFMELIASDNLTSPPHFVDTSL